MEKRIYSAGIVFAFAVLAMVIGSLIPLSPQDAQQLSEQFNQTIRQNGVNVPFIFANNFSIDLLMFVPVIGPVLGFLILFNTGLVGGALVVTEGLPSYTALFIVATPVFWLEFAAYTIAMTESIWLFRRLLQGRWREIKWTAIAIGVCAGLLIISAIVEVWLINALS
ncbi:MAG: stage II sporulation protein M [Candidatus Bathyarchaeota archaeon]|nr:stage II sporulation protein M [Candidatus Bathyarchaeota archaeon]